MWQKPFLAGLSTRDLARITEKHSRQKVYSKQVSRLVDRAGGDLEVWRTRKLKARYKLLYVGGANSRGGSAVT